MSDSAIGDIEFESYSIDGVSRSSSSDAEVRAGFAEGSGLSASVGIDAASDQQLKMRLDSLQQENRVLRMELETLKCKCKGLEEENRELKKSRVDIQLMAEQQEEFISNTLLKKIEVLKSEKEQLARNYEQEEEFLTNDLSRKLLQLRSEKSELEGTLMKEQEHQMEKLLKRIDRLQNEVSTKQSTLEQLKKDKVELENQLEQEQEALVNRLWKRMDKLEAEKRLLQQKLDQPVSNPTSPRHSVCSESSPASEDVAGTLIQNIQTLKAEVSKLQSQLRATQTQHKETMDRYAEEERHIRQENLRLQRKLQMEIERREQLCRRLSESESSMEMDEERHFNEMSRMQDMPMTRSASLSSSAPVPYSPSLSARPLSPGLAFNAQFAPATNAVRTIPPTAAAGFPSSSSTQLQTSTKSQEKFIKPQGVPPLSASHHH